MPWGPLDDGWLCKWRRGRRADVRRTGSYRNSSSSSSRHDPALSAPSSKRGLAENIDANFALDDEQRATAETVRARVADVATPVISADAPFEPAPAEEQDYYRRRRGDQPEKWPLAALAALPVKLED